MNASSRVLVTLGLGAAASAVLAWLGPLDPAHPSAYWNFTAAPAARWCGVLGLLIALIAAHTRPDGPRRRQPWGRAPALAVDLAAFVLGTAVFVSFADTARGGDFERVIFDITHGVSLIKAEPLSPWMMGLIAKAADAAGLAPLPGLRLGLAVWGGLGVVALRHLAFAIADDEPNRGLLGWVTLLSAGTSALLFAHVETYTFAAVCMCMSLASAVRATRVTGAAGVNPRAAFEALGWFTLACAMHMQMLCLGPALAYAMYRSAAASEAGPQRTRRLNQLAGAAVASGLALGGLQWLCAHFPTPYPQHFGGGDGQMLIPFGQLGSTPHLFGVANELLLMAPGALLVMVCLAGRPRLRSPVGQVMSLAAAGWMLFAALWNPDLGAWRDWDLFAAVGWWFAAFAIALCLDDEADPRAPWLLLLATGLQLTRTIPFVLHNHGAAG